MKKHLQENALKCKIKVLVYPNSFNHHSLCCWKLVWKACALKTKQRFQSSWIIMFCTIRFEQDHHRSTDAIKTVQIHYLKNTVLFDWLIFNCFLNDIWLIVIQLQKRLYNQKCPSVCLFISLSAKPLNSLKPSSFIILLSSFIIVHSSFIILPSFRDF